MNQRALNHLLDHDGVCNELLSMAQRELAAFFRAVTELFGPEQAELSAEDWLHEVEISRTMPATSREWRQITLRVVAQLGDHCEHLPALSAAARFQAVSY